MSNIQVVKGHIEYFADKNNNLTTESMRKGHTNQGITGLIVGPKIRAIHNMMDNNNNFTHFEQPLNKGSGCPFARQHNVETLCKVRNPGSTGIWNNDGTFNKEIFESIVARSTISQINKDGTYEIIITKQHFWDHLGERHSGKTLGNACHIFKIIPISWERVTRGSINEMFDNYGDITWNNEPAFTKSTLYNFYTNPSRMMREKEQTLF
jgi:hypothetical protein